MIRVGILFLMCLFIGGGITQAQVSSTKENYAEGVNMIQFKGQIVDSANYVPLPRAVVHIVSKLQTGLATQWVVADTLGRFHFKIYNFCPSRIEISMLGYRLKTIHLDKSEPMRDLGRIPLSPDPIHLDEVTVKARQRLSYLMGDTLRINASAVKTMEGDALITILQQIPELSVNGDGSVSYQGELISNVTVNNKKIFGDDHISPYYLLSAEDATYIDVFEEDHEDNPEATFTGAKRKRMNIFTVKDFDHYTAGSITAESGVHGGKDVQRDFNDRYALGGGLGLYSEPRQFVVTAAMRNIPEGAVFYSTTNTLLFPSTYTGDHKDAGLRYDIVNKNKNKYQFKFDVDNHTYNRLITRELIYRQTDVFGSRKDYTAQIRKGESNGLHSDFSMSLLSMPETAIEFSSSLDCFNGESSTEINQQVMKNENVISTVQDLSESTQKSFKIPINFRLSHKFNNHNLLTVQGDFSYNNSTRNIDQDINLSNSNTDLSTTTLDINQENPELNAHGHLKYICKFDTTKNKQISISANMSYQNSDQTKIANDRITGEINDLYSMNRCYTDKKANVSLGVSWEKASVGITYSHINLQSDELNHEVNADLNLIGMSIGFWDFLGIRGSLGYSQHAIALPMLSNKLNVDNPLFLSVGNPNLKPTKLYRLDLGRFIDPKKRIYVCLQTEYGTDCIIGHREYFAESTELGDEYDNYVVNPGAVLDTYINGSNRFSMKANASVNHSILGVGKISSSVDYSYNRIPQGLNGKIEHINSQRILFNFSYISNFSYVFRLTLRNNLSYDHSMQSDYSTSGISNKTICYTTGDLFGRIRIEAAYILDYYDTPVNNKVSHLLNLRLGMRVFKNRRGVISLNAMDILDKNNQWQHQNSALGFLSSREQRFSNYYSVSFAYKFNNKK